MDGVDVMRVVGMVCDVVDSHMVSCRRAVVDRSRLFDCRVHRVPYGVAMARRLSFVVLHDEYGMTYGELFGVSGYSAMGTLMTLVTSTRYLIEHDEEYHVVYHRLLGCLDGDGA